MKNKRLNKIFADTYLAIILAILYLPILVIIVFSFANNSNFSFAGGFSLEAYRSIFQGSGSEALGNAVKNTLVLATVSAVLSTFVGAFATIGIYYLKGKVKDITLTVNQLPMINSEIVMAVALMLFFTAFGAIFPQGWTRLILGHVSFCTPYVVLSVLPRLQKMDPNMYEAALDLGATPIKAIFRVIFPYTMPGIISGFVMAFTLSMDDFIITQLNKGTTGIETLSTLIYEDARLKNLEPYWFAVFSIFFVVVLTVLLVVNVKKNTVKGGNK